MELSFIPVDSSPLAAPSFTSPTTPHHLAVSTAIQTPEPSDEAGKAVERHGFPSTDVEMLAAISDRTHVPRPHPHLGSDPYGLALSYKTEFELDQIRGGMMCRRSCYRFPLVVGWRRHGGNLRGFYERQNAAIVRMLKSVEEHRIDARQEQGDDQPRLRLAVYGSLVANIVLAVLQIYAAATSASLSLVTTMADAVLDPLSTLALIMSKRAIERVDPRRFPAGKARLETVGNIVFCFLMTTVSFVILTFAIRQLVQGSSSEGFHLASVVSVGMAFAIKLALFLCCWSIKDKYSQVKILWQDHRNDLFVNGFGILTSVGGAKLVRWIDPAGAIVLSVLMSGLWLREAFGEFMLLVGVAASVERQQLITYVCLTHSAAIRSIDTVRLYHSGPRLIAEVDIVMDPGGTLVETHDLAEDLQSKLESLPDVERAYVHIDYETTHKPEHAYKKDL